VIETRPFGRTGHQSTRLIFGAAALFNATQAEADAVLEQLLAAGVNHIDAAAGYGDAELRLAPWMQRHRDDFFLATKTRERGFAEAREQIEASRQRMQVDCIDLIQLHCLVDPEEWEVALGADGALRAALEARDAGHVRFVGVTGHGTRTAAMHLKSLERYAFDSVLLPASPVMLADPDYARDFEALRRACRDRGVAVQTIKAIARRRWPHGKQPDRTCWYQPLESPAAIERAIHFVLAHDDLFVNSASDRDLLRHALAAAASFRGAPSPEQLATDREEHAIEPLFFPGYEGVGRGPKPAEAASEEAP
jgi:aryl-alcohol dehydrogenase-like predicted oxidoreductase